MEEFYNLRTFPRGGIGGGGGHLYPSHSYWGFKLCPTKWILKKFYRTFPGKRG